MGVFDRFKVQVPRPNLANASSAMADAVDRLERSTNDLETLLKEMIKQAQEDEKNGR